MMDGMQGPGVGAGIQTAPWASTGPSGGRLRFTWTYHQGKEVPHSLSSKARSPLLAGSPVPRGL